MNKHVQSANTLRKIRLAVQNDDYGLACEAWREAGTSEYFELASSIRDRFVCYPDVVVNRGKMSCRPVTDEQTESSAAAWMEAVKSEKNPFELLGNVIADNDCHPLWRERVIASLADNEFDAAAADKNFALANMRAVIYYLPVNHPRFDALALNMVRYFLEISETNEQALKKIHANVAQSGISDGSKRVDELAQQLATPSRATPKEAKELTPTVR